MPWLSRLVAGLSPSRLRFDPRTPHVRCVVYEVTLIQVFLWVFPCLYQLITSPYSSSSTRCSYQKNNGRSNALPESVEPWIWKFFHFLCGFAKLRKATISFVMSVCLSVCPSAWNTSAPTEWIFIKLDIWTFFENPSRRFKFHETVTRITVLYMKACMHFSNISLNSS